jgi:flagellar hook-basal body complex protein FliE
MSISGISSLSGIGALPLPQLSAPATTTAAAKPDFGNMVAQGLEKLQATQANSDNLAVKATTGNLTDIHDYMIAANESTVATQLTVAVRNKAVEAFTEIMRMQM